jgi:hypothetical protein
MMMMMIMMMGDDDEWMLDFPPLLAATLFPPLLAATFFSPLACRGGIKGGVPDDHLINTTFFTETLLPDCRRIR